jgi:hypothetical protein
MPVSRRLAAAITAFGVASAVLVPSAPAGATTRCTAWGAMPTRVALHSSRTDLTIVLRGSAGCYHQRTDNGARARFVDPTGSREDMLFRHFGSTQSVTVYVNIARPGRYVLRDGNVQVYDHSYERVAWSWRRTAVVVKRAAHIFRPRAGGGIVSGRTMRYTKYGWSGYRGKRVFVQRRPVGTSTWHALGSVLAARKGYVRFATATSSRFQYRMYVTATSAVWGASSAAVRG